MLDAVIARIEDDARPFPDLITRFARSYLRRVPPAPALSADDLHDEVVGLYEFIEVRSEPIAVRAFNPPADDDVGPPTVIEVNIDDGPFLVDSIGNELQAHGLGVSRVLHPVIGVQRDERGASPMSDRRVLWTNASRSSIGFWSVASSTPTSLLWSRHCAGSSSMCGPRSVISGPWSVSSRE